MIPSSAPAGFSTESFTFLEGLENNNTRDWFTSNRATYDSALRLPFAELLESVSDALADSDVRLSGGERTIFRINRDVRFAADKTPYNTHVSGVLTPSGTKAESRGLVYLHLDAGGGFLAAGLYRPPVPRLTSVRAAMIDKPEVFDQLLTSLHTAGLALDRSEVTRSMPRGFSEYSAHPHAEWIKLKNAMVTVPLDRADWLRGDMTARVKGFALDAAPLLRFLDAH